MIMKRLPFDYAVRNLGRSPRRLLGILLGNLLVVMIVLAAASFVEGMRRTFSPGDLSPNVILLGVGSEESIERSEIPATTAGILAASVPGIRTVGGVPFVSPEILSALILRENAASTLELRGIVRGITPAAFLVHPRVEIIAGRAPRAGANELLIGSLVAEKLSIPRARLALGQTLWFDDSEWKIVGHFRAPGTVMDAEIWTPLSDLQIATRRDAISAVFLTLGEAEFSDIDAFAKMRIDLELIAIAQSEYDAALLRFYRPVRIMIWATAILVALSGTLGGFNSLYAAFSARSREIGMLQSLGFSRRAIALSLIQESLLAASLALIIALCLGWLFLDGIAISFSMGVFQLTLSARVIASAACTAVVLGLLGSLPPAWHCLRLPITEALKTS